MSEDSPTVMLVAGYMNLVPNVESHCNLLLSQEEPLGWSARPAVVRLDCVFFVTNQSRHSMCGVKVAVTEDTWNALSGGSEAAKWKLLEIYVQLVVVSNEWNSVSLAATMINRKDCPSSLIIVSRSSVQLQENDQ